MAEYVNIEGKFALNLKQLSLNGENSVTISCGDKGLFGVATLQEPSATMIGHFEIIIGGEGYEPNYWKIIQRSNFRTQVAFDIPAEFYGAIARAATFGARIVVSAKTFFYGFEQTMRDGKFCEMVAGCKPSVAARTSSNSMTIYRDVDFPGQDLTPNGFRGISFQECQQICLGEVTCAALSYVVSKQWCWPKGSAAQPQKAPGILGAFRH